MLLPLPLDIESKILLPNYNQLCSRHQCSNLNMILFELKQFFKSLSAAPSVFVDRMLCISNVIIHLYLLPELSCIWNLLISSAECSLMDFSAEAKHVANSIGRTAGSFIIQKRGAQPATVRSHAALDDRLYGRARILKVEIPLKNTIFTFT